MVQVSQAYAVPSRREQFSMLMHSSPALLMGFVSIISAAYKGHIISVGLALFHKYRHQVKCDEQTPSAKTVNTVEPRWCS